jgi:hypothetical protein
LKKTVCGRLNSRAPNTRGGEESEDNNVTTNINPENERTESEKK